MRSRLWLVVSVSLFLSLTLLIAPLRVAPAGAAVLRSGEVGQTVPDGTPPPPESVPTSTPASTPASTVPTPAVSVIPGEGTVPTAAPDTRSGAHIIARGGSGGMGPGWMVGMAVAALLLAGILLFALRRSPRHR